MGLRKPEMASQLEVTPQMLAAMRQGEIDNEWLRTHQEALEPFRGQWVVVHDRRVVAHSPDGRAAARAVDPRTHPGATIFYVPTHAEAEAVRILVPA
jgi:hypothetical protein